MTNTKGTKRPE